MFLMMWMRWWCNAMRIWCECHVNTMRCQYNMNVITWMWYECDGNANMNVNLNAHMNVNLNTMWITQHISADVTALTHRSWLKLIMMHLNPWFSCPNKFSAQPQYTCHLRPNPYMLSKHTRTKEVHCSRKDALCYISIKSNISIC